MDAVVVVVADAAADRVAIRGQRAAQRAYQDARTPVGLISRDDRRLHSENLQTYEYYGFALYLLSFLFYGAFAYSWMCRRAR